jgi:hypothetical protein
MRKAIIALACLVISTSAIAIEAQDSGQPAATSPKNENIRVVQRCGWYAIYSCSRSRREAQRIADEFGGRVINTSRDEYPNFQPGYFCTVDGPMSRSEAMRTAARLRATVARDAYAKSAC